uniref:SOGA 1/2-like coiled-coil domain-containing protein n=1 Tax=Myripristis murdjan TaxID=586833 RepID=A0A668AQA3_9TELE
MDLRCRLEHNERDWLREKAELLERFDTERREWENQLRDMQRKIEEVRERECVFLDKMSPRQRDSVTDSKDTVDTAELEALFHGAPACGVPQRNSGTSKGNVKNVHGGSQESHLSSELNYGSDKKKNTTALNAALKEIARVSEELCSYQDEIRRKTGDKRYINPHCYIYDDLRALEKENWISLSPDNTWRTNSTGIDSHRDSQSNFKRLSDLDTDAPPVPPRISSWSLSSPTPPELELHIPESSLISGGKCHSPCALMDRKCSSPSIVRKFEAMLQKNEGKILTDGVIASCSVPANSNCNVGCCHSRWSCDVSKFSSNKLAPYLPVQKSFSEVNILTAGKELSPNYRPGVGNLKSPEGHEIVAGSSPKRERPHTAKATASPQQPSAETKSKLMTQPGHQTQPRHPSVTSSQSDTPRPGPRVMNDHPWKPLTLAAYPRPEGSRSNYGAVERILKSYESAAWAQENQNQQNEMPSSPSRSPKQEERVIELLDMLDMDPLPLPPKNFSRPARPANRRLPSRWASRSPSSSSSTSSSPSTTPVVPPSISYQKHTSSFTYSHAFHMETVII